MGRKHRLAPYTASSLPVVADRRRQR